MATASISADARAPIAVESETTKLVSFCSKLIAQ